MGAYDPRKQGGTFCRKEKKGMGVAQRTSEKYCSVCGRHRRGPGHDEGAFHKKRKKESENR